jgi:hypothetical protein
VYKMEETVIEKVRCHKKCVRCEQCSKICYPNRALCNHTNDVTGAVPQEMHAVRAVQQDLVCRQLRTLLYRVLHHLSCFGWSRMLLDRS